MRTKGYVFNLLIALDILASAILAGQPGETLSGRAGSAEMEGKLRGKIFAPLIDFIMRDPLHCANAVKGDKVRAQAVLDQRT